MSTVGFFLVHLVPGDPIDMILGDQASPSDREKLRSSLNLDKPLFEQYLVFLRSLASGDLGQSLTTKRPNLELILERLPATLELTVMSLLLTVLIGIPLGTWSAVSKGNGVDSALSVVGLIGLSVPNFWLGPMLILVFAIGLGWLPVSDRGSLAHLILPSLSLATSLAAIVMRMTRAAMIDILSEDYVRTAFAKGLSSRVVYFKHVLANSLSPVVTILGLQLGSLLTGAVITETIFDWPGIGTLFFSAIQSRDYPLIQACFLFVAGVYVVINQVTDLIYRAINPKVAT